MKFQKKYELQEQITSGAIEVFVCEDTESGLPRLLYLVKAETISGEIADRDVLQKVRAHGPDPAGIILQLGTSETDFHPYVVTTLPKDPLAVQRWVEAYREFGRASSGKASASPSSADSARGNGVGIPVVEPTKNSEATGLETSMEPRLGQSPLGSTAAGSRLPALGLGDTALIPTAKGEEKSGTKLPAVSNETGGHPLPEKPAPQVGSSGLSGAFTKEFLAALEGSSVRPAPPPNSTSPKQATPSADSGILRPTDLPKSPAASDPNSVTAAFTAPVLDKSGETFLSSSGAAPNASLGPDPRASQTGEFTRFMRGFDVPQSIDSPVKLDSAPQLQRVEEKAPGEFTRIFGEGTAHNPAVVDLNSDVPSTAPANRPRIEHEPGPLTRILQGHTQAQPIPAEPSGKAIAELNATPAAKSPELVSDNSNREFSTATPNLSSAPAKDSLESLPQPMWDKAEPAGATRVFTVPGEQQPRSTPVKGGPSEYTRIISGPGYSAPPERARESLEPPAAANPNIPAKPPMSAAPFAAPAVQPPSAPKPPAIGGAPKPGGIKAGGVSQPVSYWPVIVVLNLLLFAAIALVLYFWLKPH